MGKRNYFIKMLLRNNINPFSLASRIKRPLILDGAMGSLLQHRGIKKDDSMWMSKANIENPEIVFKIHREYIEAGADIITTNTFRTNPLAIKNEDLKIKKLIRKSVKIAKDAIENLPIFLAGSNAPAEDCYQIERTLTKKELEYNHHKHISLLYANGVDFILNETQSHFDEIKIICKYCNRENIPYVISLFFTNSYKLLSKNKLIDVIKFIIEYEPLAISFNCIMSNIFFDLIKTAQIDYDWGVYLNLGSGSFSDVNIETSVSPDDYKRITKEILSFNPSFIGACCGSTPAHIKEIKSFLDE